MREELELKGLFNSLAENRTPRGRAYAMQNCAVDLGIIQLGPRYDLLGQHSAAHASDVGYGFGYGKFGCNETQRLTVTGTPTGGTVKLSWENPAGSNQITANIDYDCTATEMYDALMALSNIDLGDVSVTGGPWPTYPIDVTFKGAYGRLDVNIIVLNTNALTGGTTPTVGIVERVQGGTQEVYLSVIKKNGDTDATLFEVDPDTGTHTQIATGLDPSNWFFIQYRDKIYAGNAKDGLQHYQLGGDWSGPVGNPSFGNPTLPPKISADNGSTYPQLISFATASAGSFVGWGVNPTPTYQATGIKFLLNAALAEDYVEFVVTLAASADYSYEDQWTAYLTSNVGDNSVNPDTITLQQINNDGSPLTIDPIATSVGQISESATSTTSSRWFHFGNKNRTDRDNVLKFKVTMIVKKGTSAKTLTFQLLRAKVWLNDKQATLDIAKPITKPIDYAFSYYDVSADEESKLSPVVTSIKVPPAGTIPTGRWIELTAPGNANLLTSDKVRFYRRDHMGVWRRFAEAANVTSGYTAAIYDKYMVDELPLFEQYGVVQLPGGFNPEQLGIFKQCLVVLADLKLWISGVGAPLFFAYDPEDVNAPPADETDENGPRTVFLSDNRAEDGYAVIGQDSLYSPSPYSSYAMVGDKPLLCSPPRRLPGSRGATGYRAAFAFGGGIEVPSQDGLFYYSVGRGFSGEDNGAMMEREETLEVRRSWQTTLVGDSYSGMVGVEHLKEMWIFNGTKYLRLTRNNHWEEGTFADSVFAAIATREHGLVFMNSKGQLMSVSDDYADDNGTAATWSYETGLLDGPAIKIEAIEIQCTGTPRVVVTVYDGNNTPLAPYTLDITKAKQVNRFPVMIQPGYRFKFAFSGGSGDKVENVAIYFESVGQRRGN